MLRTLFDHGCHSWQRSRVTPEWTRSRTALLLKAFASATWIWGHSEIRLLCATYSSFLSFSKALFSICSWVSQWIYVCMYLCVRSSVFMLCTVQQSFSLWKKCKSTQDVAHNSSLYKNSYFLILMCVEIHFFFPVLEIFLVWLGSGRIGMCLEQTLEWEWSGGPILLPWKPMLKDHIMLSFSQQTWMKSKIWSQKITTSIKWIQVFWDKYSMGLFPNKISNGTEKMGLPSIW